MAMIVTKNKFEKGKHNNNNKYDIISNKHRPKKITRKEFHL